MIQLIKCISKTQIMSQHNLQDNMLLAAKVVCQIEVSSSLFDHLPAFPAAVQQLDICIFFYTARCSSVIAAVQKACSCVH